MQTREPAGNPFMPMPVVIKIANAAATYDTSIVIYHYAPDQLGYTDRAYGMWPAGDDFITYNLSFVPAIITIDPDNKTMATGTLNPVTSPLDVNIISFTGNKTATGNQINLSITNDEPVEKVILLKSANGIDFSDAGLMNKLNIPGSVNNYRFIDVLAFSPVTFYRAKIFAGVKEEYSGIVKVQQSVSNTLTVSPNPAADVVNISFNNTNREKVTVRVINAEGKVVIESATNNDFIHFDISNLPAGIYIAQVIKPGQVTDTNKFLVRK